MLKFGRCVMVTLQKSPARIALFPDRGNNTLGYVKSNSAQFPPASSNHGIFRSQTADRFRCQFATASSTGQHIDAQGAHVFRIGKSGPSFDDSIIIEYQTRDRRRSIEESFDRRH